MIVYIFIACVLSILIGLTNSIMYVMSIVPPKWRTRILREEENT